MERIDTAHQPSGSHRILLVTGRRLLAEGLELLFRQHVGWQVNRAETLQEALTLVERWRPEVVIVDLSLPEGEAFLLFQRLPAQAEKIRVAFLDDSLQPARLAAVQRLQAPGYFTLRDSFECIVAGLREILAGRTVYTAGVKVFLSKSTPPPLASPPQTVPAREGTGKSKQVASPFSRLSRREMEVLIHLARGLTVKQCAEQLHLSPNTVDNHKARLMSKLGIHRSVDLIRLALREKLIEQ